jgi:xylulokinase
MFPEIVSSHQVIGTINEETSKLTGLPTSVKVVCGGVDNSCMALGAKGIKEGRIYTSLGSSAWIALTSGKPILDLQYKPFVFAHVIDNMYASATSIFSAGNSFRWVRDNICPDLKEREKDGKPFDAYYMMDQCATKSPIGANRLLFNPSLAGGSMIEEAPDIRGGYVGLSLSHNRADLIRAAMEGIAFNLRYALDVLKLFNNEISDMLIVGGGSKSELWMQIFADIYNLKVIKTNIDQDAASLGAAALAAYGTGVWTNYDVIDQIHKVESVKDPVVENSSKYMRLYEVYKQITHYMAESGKLLAALDF